MPLSFAARSWAAIAFTAWVLATAALGGSLNISYVLVAIWLLYLSIIGIAEMLVDAKVPLLLCLRVACVQLTFGPIVVPYS